MPEFAGFVVPQVRAVLSAFERTLWKCVSENPRRTYMRTPATAGFGNITRILLSVSLLSLLVPTRASAFIFPCRLFPDFSLSLAYVSGDQQNGTPNSTLPQPLEVTVIYNEF